jgi:alpha-tubulin suppressor-like RCC1 family protein
MVRATLLVSLLVSASAVVACRKTESSATTASATTSTGAGSSASDARVVGHRALAITAGYTHACALADDGRVFCWGSNSLGQLGAPAADHCDVPDLLHGGASSPTTCRERAAPVTGITNATQVVASGDSTCARLTDGTVQCWGDNAWAQLGDGTTTNRPVPTTVPGLNHVAQIALGTTHACARKDDGTVWCWGLNFAGQLGTTPVQPPPGATAKLGIGAVKVLAPQAIPGLGEVTLVAAGHEVTCVETKSGDVTCFGLVSPGMRSAAATPMPSLKGAVELALSNGTHCARFADGSGRCWGASGTAPFQPGSSAEKTPVPSSAISGASALAVGVVRACEIAAGDVFCWGDDGKGVQAKPARVTLGAKATAIALGANHGCAVTVEGSVYCWGDSFFGQAGAPVKGRGAPTSAFWTVVNQVGLP